MELRTSQEALAIDPIVETLSICAPKTKPAHPIVDISAAQGRQLSASFFRVLSNDIDNSIERVCSPDGTARPANYFDPVDVFQKGVLQLPINTGEQRCIDTSAVNQHEHCL